MHKILLVEDDEVIRQQVKKILEQWGYEVVLVEDFMGLSLYLSICLRSSQAVCSHAADRGKIFD